MLIDQHLEELLDTVQAILVVPVGCVTHCRSTRPLL
jgi:hypothetical protein